MKKTSVWAIVLILTSVLFLSSCAHDDRLLNSEETVSVTDLAISDPEIKKEIEFMKSKGIITNVLYEKWLTSSRRFVLDESDILIDEKGTKRHDQYYRISNPLSDEILEKGITTDEKVIDRKYIQSLMQQSNQENKRFHVKNAGFWVLNQSYESYKAKALKIEKSGTPYTEETIRIMYHEALKLDQLLYDEGFDGYPTNEEVEKWNTIKSTSATITSQHD